MKLLVAIDFSELAEQIIAEAEKLATVLHAKVFLLHVVPPPSPIMDVPPDVEALIPPEEVFKKTSITAPFDIYLSPPNLFRLPDDCRRAVLILQLLPLKTMRFRRLSMKAKKSALTGSCLDHTDMAHSFTSW